MITDIRMLKKYFLQLLKLSAPFKNYPGALP